MLTAHDVLGQSHAARASVPPLRRLRRRGAPPPNPVSPAALPPTAPPPVTHCVERLLALLRALSPEVHPPPDPDARVDCLAAPFWLALAWAFAGVAAPLPRRCTAG